MGGSLCRFLEDLMCSDAELESAQLQVEVAEEWVQALEAVAALSSSIMKNPYFLHSYETAQRMAQQRDARLFGLMLRKTMSGEGAACE